MNDKEETRDCLKKLLLKGKYTIYTVCNHVSKSGMFRTISLYIATKQGQIICVDWHASQLGVAKINKKHGGLSVSGYGMDMGFALVSNLSIALYCPEKYNHDKAYKLEQRWL